MLEEKTLIKKKQLKIFVIYIRIRIYISKDLQNVKR